MNLTDLAGADARYGLIADQARQWLDHQVPAIVVSVGATAGSVPRVKGAAMILTADECIGTIGGGHLEWQAQKFARQMLREASLDSRSQRLALGPSLGQCCGGAVNLNYECLLESHLDLIARVDAPLFRLNLFGAGHVARAVVETLATLPCQIRWIDEREDIFPATVAGATTVVNTDDALAEVGYAQADDYYLVMTHSHALDFDIVERVLRRDDHAYLGLIGSQSKRIRFERRLDARGLDPARLICPIGQDGITGKEPWCIALSVAADLLARARCERVVDSRLCGASTARD